jgi:eukaryotic-like serine/threonine-protein kinase
LFGMAIAEQLVGKNDLAITHFQDLQRLDPRSPSVALSLGQALHYRKRYDEALSALDVSVALAPTSLNAIEWKFMVYLSEGNLPRAQAYLASVAGTLQPTDVVAYFATYYDLYWCLDADQQALLRRLTPAQFDNDAGSWGLALAGSYGLQGDRKRMLAYADSARLGFETQLHDTPDDAQIHALLGLALAYLGRKADAIREGERSLELLPPARNVVSGSYNQHQVVRIYMLVGEPEKALDNLEILLKEPYYLTPAWLKIDPNFDPLRKNPRFQKLIAGN